MSSNSGPTKHFLLVSDFDQTLSFNDSGVVLSEVIGASGFQEKVAGLAHINLVQQGAELAYLIRHDPEFRGVRAEQLAEAGRLVRLRKDIPALVEFLERGIEGYRFSFFVVSAAPKEVIQSALAGIVSPDHIFGTEFEYDAAIRRSRIDPPRSRGLRQGLGARGAGAQARHRAEPDHLRGRRQLGRPRDAARQQPGRVHDRGLGEQAAGQDRPEHGPERQRVQRRRAHPRADRGVALAGRSARCSNRTG